MPNTEKMTDKYLKNEKIDNSFKMLKRYHFGDYVGEETAPHDF